jgi:hypothetical protein
LPIFDIFWVNYTQFVGFFLDKICKKAENVHKKPNFRPCSILFSLLLGIRAELGKKDFPVTGNEYKKYAVVAQTT